MIKKIKLVPSLPAQASKDAFNKSRLRSLDLIYSIVGIYDPLIEAFRSDLQGHFTNFFNNEIDPKLKQPVWSLILAKKHHTVEILSESFNDMMDSAKSEVESFMDEDLSDEFEESYLHGLWGIYESGVDMDDVPFFSENERVLFLLAAGVAGLTYRDRLLVATSIAKGRFITWLRSTIVAARTLLDTIQGYNTITNSLKRRITTLSENENHRAYIMGQEKAADVFPADLYGLVWLARPDSCQICVPKHLTITSDRPSDDSHPGCRCMKIPIAIDYTGRPIDYVGFLQSIGKR